jgi:hypothetical protein
MAYKVPDLSYEEKAKYLEERGWQKSWSDDNWVRSNALNKEANTGIDTNSAFYYQYGVDNKLRYKVNIK